MSVRRPLEKMKEEVDVDALIDAGAKVKEDLKKEKNKWPIINVRISAAMLEAVDRVVQRKVGLTRTGWILQAIDEKLTSDG